VGRAHAATLAGGDHVAQIQRHDRAIHRRCSESTTSEGDDFMRIFLNLIAAVSMLAAATMAHAVKPIANILDAPIVSPAGKTLNLDQIKLSIMRAGAGLGWKMAEEKPGLLVATLDIRKHQAVVEIPYSATKYSITYRSSINLDESNGQIHRNYNGWILNFTQGINRQLELN
jgi:hypothetical protein